MKRTQLKDALRNIAKQKVSYLSIIVIALLGVSIFLGLDYSAAGLRKNCSSYFNSRSFRDIEVQSTLLLTPEDLRDIETTEGVADLEPVWQIRAKASSGGDRQDVDVISLTERINLPLLVEGRLPETATECAVEQILAREMGWSVGDELLVQNAAGAPAQYLPGERYVITGIVNHPDHSNRTVTDVYYVMVTREAFDLEALDGCCMKAEILVDRPADAFRFAEDYTGRVSAVCTRLEDLALTDAPRRDGAAREQFRAEIEEQQQTLDEGRLSLEDARRELDEGWDALAEGEQTLSEARTQLDAAKAELDGGQAQLDAAKAELDAGKAQLDAGAAALAQGKAELDAAKTELETGWSELEDAKASLRSAVEDALGEAAGSISWASPSSVDVDSSGATAMVFWITSDYSCDLNRSLAENINDFVYSGAITDEMLLEGYIASTGSAEGFDAAALRAALALATASAAAPYEGQYALLQSSCRQWDEAHATYLSALQTYNEKLAEVEAGRAAWEVARAQYEESLAAWEDGKAQYEEGLRAFEDGQKQLDENRQKLEDGEAAWADGQAQLDYGEGQLSMARRQLADLDPCRWIVLDGKGNPGYVQINTAGKNLQNLKSTFALLFILVGALVIFATISKMVDEQRTQVGTTKALGFFNREVFAKYLCFGVTAAVLGTVLGMLAARFGLERFVLNSYGIYYTYPLSQAAVTPLPTLITLLASAGLAVAAIWAACRSLLRTPAIRLMQAKVPQGAKKSGGKRKSGLSLYSRLILLNMRTDLRRVLVTVVSVAGCCALVVIGITLKSAMTGSAERQFNGIMEYDWLLRFSPEESETTQEELEALLREAGTDYAALRMDNVNYRFGDMQTAELFSGDVEQLRRFYRLDDWETGQPLAGAEEGVLIQRRVAECYDLRPGSRFSITLGGTREAQVPVAGIFEHYFGRPMVMSPAAYEQAFRRDYVPNAFFVRLNGADAAALEEALRAVKGFSSLTASDSDKAVFDESTGVVNSLVALFIFMAAVMAGVVLMNLTAIYVLQKKRELTIMRVNGFTVREVVGYMLRETVLTTILGILLGSALGSWIAYRILRTLEQPFLQFPRGVSVPAWIVAAIITLFFAALVNYFALRPVRNLKLSDVA